MPRIDTNNSSRTFTLVLIIAVVAVLYLAQAILIPFALAILVSFLLAPLVSRLERLRLGRVPSVVLVVAVAFLVISAVLGIVVEQAIDLAEKFPQYRTEIDKKIDTLREHGLLGKLRRGVDEFNEKVANPRSSAGEESSPGERKLDEPVRVAIVDKTGLPWGALSTLVPGIFSLLANAGVVTLFVVFMLIEREDLRNRFIRLIGPHQISMMTQAMDDAAERVSKYLRAQLIVNASFGLTLAIGLFFIGIPNAPLWGLTAALLRYIPYAGSWIAAIGPLTVALATENWSVLLLTGGLFAVLELITNNVLEPVLYRSSTGISTIGILVATVFWTWLWGPIGLILATPLTVCFAVIGRYVRRLEFLNTLLSDEPVLSPGAHYYQRLLSGDHHEADTLVERQLAKGSLEQLYGEVLLPALALAEQDRHNGLLAEGKQDYILQSIREVIEELPDRAVTEPTEDANPEVASVPGSERTVICLPARDEADELAAQMLSQLLDRHDYRSQSISVKALASEMLDLVDEGQVGTVCVSAIPPFAVSHARYLCKRLRARFPNLKIVLGLWQMNDVDKNEERLRGGSADKIVTSFEQALKEI